MNDPIERSVRGEVTLPSGTRAHDEMTQTSAGMLMPAEESREVEQIRVRSLFKDAVRRFSRNWAAVASLAIIVVLIIMSAFAPYMHTADPNALDYFALNGGPSWHHWFGTDAVGRDEYTRILYGLRVPFIIAFTGTTITVFLGLLIGLTAGYFGGFIDSLASRFTDFMFAFPAFLMIIIVVTIYDPWFSSHFPNGVGRAVILTGVFALVSWPPLMRFIRSLALSIKEQQFIEAARTSGTSNMKIIWRHLIPNVWGLVLVQAALTVAYILGAEAVLAIFSYGVNEPTPDLGTMLYDGAQSIDVHPWQAFFPSLFLTILIVAFTFIGDGIRDAVDTRMNR